MDCEMGPSKFEVKGLHQSSSWYFVCDCRIVSDLTESYVFLKRFVYCSSFQMMSLCFLLMRSGMFVVCLSTQF